MKQHELGALTFWFGLVLVILSLAITILGATILGLFFMVWGLMTVKPASKKYMLMIFLAVLFILTVMYVFAMVKYQFRF